MSDAPACSLVVSSYNQAHTLRATLDSILAQDESPVECMVIDQASTDATVNILREYAGQIDWESVSQADCAAAVSRAFNRSRGELMWWVSGADKLTPWGVRLVSFVFKNLSPVQWLTSGTPLTWTRSQMCISTGLADGYSRNTFFAGRNLKTSPYFHCPIWRQGTAWRRSLWDKAGARVASPLDQAGDFELWLRYWNHAELYTMNIPLAGQQAVAEEIESAAYWGAATDHLNRAGRQPSPSGLILRARGQIMRRIPSTRQRFAHPAPHIWISPPTLECGISTHYIL